MRRILATIAALLFVSGAALAQPTPLAPVAKGSVVPRAFSDRAADTLNLKDFGAFLDGTPHPLSARYHSLAEAQRDYPFVTSLAQQSDSVAVQAALNACAKSPNGATIRAPAGTALFSEGVSSSSNECNIVAPSNGVQTSYSVGDTGGTFATRFLNYTGFAGTMVRFSPVENLLSSNQIGSGIQGVLLDCNRTVGCTGLVQKSGVFFTDHFSVNEPREYVATTNAPSAAGTSVLYFANTAAIPGLEIGAAVTDPNITRGTYVFAYTGTSVTLSSALPPAASFTAAITGTSMVVTAVASNKIHIGQVITGTNVTGGTTVIGRAYGTVDGVGTYTVSVSQTVVSEPMATVAGVASGESVGFAGEGARFDTAQTYGTNTLSWFDVDFQGINSGSNAPLIAVQGSTPATGNGNYGNPALGRFHRVMCYTQAADCLVMGNSDHIQFDWLQQYPINPPYQTGNCMTLAGGNVSGGASQGGPAYSNHFGYVSCQQPIVVQGTDTPWSYPSSNHRFDWLDYNNGTLPPQIGTGSSAYSASDQGFSLTFDGSLYGVVAQLPDNTLTRGSARGTRAVDLQTTRDIPGQIAFGTYSTLAGGYGNTAYGYGSAVTGGLYAQSFGTYSRAGGHEAYSFGYGWDCYGSNNGGNNYAAEACLAVLNKVSNASTGWRLTGDGNVATTGLGSSNNCLNIIDNSQFTMDIQLSAFDRSNTSLWYSWHEPHAVMRRVSGVGSTTYTASGTAAALGNMTVSAAPTVTADTTNGCLSLVFNPPASNTDYIGATATIRFTWTQ